MKNDYRAGISGVIETPLESESVTGVQTFPLNAHAPRNVTIDYFYFVDGNGDIVDATAGSVEITVSPVAGVPRKMEQGQFEAKLVRLDDWEQPYFYGRTVELTVSLTAIAGAVGFRMFVSQGVSPSLFKDSSGLNDETMSVILRDALLEMNEVNGCVLLELRLLSARFEAMAETHLNKEDLEK